jgi:DNA-binding Xre family transcriptional regulator
MHGIDEGLIKRIRDLVLRMGEAPRRALPPVDESQDRTRASVRQLARRHVSHLLRQLRAAHGLTYAQVQEQTGLSQQLLYDFEYKDRRLSLEELRALAQCYEVSINDLLGVDLE